MNITSVVRGYFEDNLPYEDVLPTQMPVYVNSVAYLFGASALSGLAMLIFTGLVLALFGPLWHHTSSVGYFFNSLHFWSVQVFFFAALLHFLSKFAIAGWRDGRWRTWIAGLFVFATAIFLGLTGFLLQTNWDSQWISLQAKDAMNALGVGALFNTMNAGQVVTLHTVVFPLVAVLLLSLHLFFIRSDGPVKPMAGETGRSKSGEAVRTKSGETGSEG